MDPVLAIAQERLSVEPGGEVRVGVTVRNAGELVEEYRIEVLGDAARWAQVAPRQVSVLPGTQEARTVEVTFRPPPPPASVAGKVPFGLRCVSLEDPDRCAVVEGELTVGAVIGVEAQLEPVTPSGRWTGRYRAVFHNTGSIALGLRCVAADSRRVLRFALAPAELNVRPGQSSSVYVAVKPRQPMLRGRAVSHQFSVTYRAATGDRSGEVAGVFEQHPIVSKGVIVAGALAVAAATAGAVLFLRSVGAQSDTASISGPPPPVALTSAAGLTGGSVQLLWGRSPYATGYLVQQVLSDGGVAGGKEITDGDQTALTWSELPPGKHCFRVVVVGKGGRSTPSESRCAKVAPPAPSQASPRDGASDPGQPPGASGPPTGVDTVLGAYVIYAPPSPIDDKAAQGRADVLMAKLQAAGVEARLVDSRTSDRVLDGEAGMWVVLRDGFADLRSANAECAAHRDIAPNCYAVRP